MSTVIIGGGIIGLCTAYYTALSSDRHIILIDSESQLLRSASGFSGGYIVRDWFSPAVLPLAELAWHLHKQLAEDHDGRRQWGYSQSIAYSLVMGPDGNEGKVARGEDWLLTGTSRADVTRQYVSVDRSKQDRHQPMRERLLREDGSPLWANIPNRGSLEKISSPSGCAQVEPRQLCQFLIQRCKARGVELLQSTRPTGLIRDHTGAVVALQVERELQSRSVRGALLCRDIVIAAGCWTPRVFETLTQSHMNPSVRPLPGYSIVVRSPRFHRPIRERNENGEDVETAHAVFCPPTNDWSYSAECMARFTREGKPEIYIAGLNDEAIRLPRLAGDAKGIMQQAKIDDLKRAAVALTCNGGKGDSLDLVREGLCFRPVSTSGLPIIGSVAGFETREGGKLYVASGHGPWGITLGPATGVVLSELLQGVGPSASLDAFALDESEVVMRHRL